MIYLDLFSGIGGFSEGFKRGGFHFDKHYFSEIDKHAIAVYKHNFPNAELLEDVRTIYDRTIERPNLVTFGFPCQDLSIAGKGKGLDGERSGLFFEAIRIIEKWKPEIFVFENVKGLLSSNEGKDFETVLRTIADLGIYDCEWQLVNTSWLLPQNRERVYFIGHLRGSSRPRVFPFRETDQEFNENRREAGGVVSQCIDSNYWKGADGKRTIIDDRRPTNLQGNSVDNTIRSGGRGSLTEKHNWDMVRIKSNTKKGFEDNNSPKLQSLLPMSKPLKKTLKDNDLKYGKVKALDLYNHSAHDVCPSLTDPCHNNQRVVDGRYIRRLTEVECSRLQGFPDNWTEYGNYNGVVKKVSKTQRYKMLGNAVTVDIVEMIANRLK